MALLVTLALGVAAGSLGGLSADLGPEEDGVRTSGSPDGGSDAPSSGVTGGETIGQDTYLRLLAALLATALVSCYVLFPDYRRVVGLTGCAAVVGAAGYLLYRPSANVSVPSFGSSDALGLAGVGLLVGFVVAAGLVLWRFELLGTGADPAAERDRDPDAPGGARSADRHPADGTADDPVRRAWQRMVADLHPSSPGSRTPAEFADAAKDSGRDPDAVDRLTRLFRAVRYGRRDPADCADEATTLADRVVGEGTVADDGDPEAADAGGDRR